ncbi:hypothetical protein [Marinomonas posidonica]|uniref:hypothetical protein n=1 Tax=Marinomonas posidonica TaxID=936476 RepID=UPI003736E96D
MSKIAKAVSFLILAACAVIFALYLTQKFGAEYAEEKIQQRITNAGLQTLIKYDSVHLDPFTLTPSLENVRFGPNSAPWLNFARISFNSYLFKQPNLDVDFWIKETPVNQLSRETAALFRQAGLKHVLGKGSFQSTLEGDTLESHLNLDIKDAGKLNVISHTQLSKQDLSLVDLRTDWLASVALGQPEAILYLYGEQLSIEQLSITYQDMGLLQHLSGDWPQRSNEWRILKLNQIMDQLKLAPQGSSNALELARTLDQYLLEPATLSLTFSPNTAMNLKQLALIAEQKMLAQQAKLKVTLPAN